MSVDHLASMGDKQLDYLLVVVRLDILQHLVLLELEVRPLMLV